MIGLMREPHNGIFYYAEPGAKTAIYRGNRYELWLWRDTLAGARHMAKVGGPTSGTTAIVRKIAFHKGGMFRKDPGKFTIYRYGVYLRREKK